MILPKGAELLEVTVEVTGCGVTASATEFIPRGMLEDAARALAPYCAATKLPDGSRIMMGPAEWPSTLAPMRIYRRK